jgi:hypothetical protein
MDARLVHPQTAAAPVDSRAFAITYTALYRAKRAEFDHALEAAHSRALELGPPAVSEFLLRVERITKEYGEADTT